MKQELTEIIFILDRSGSMAGLQQDTIGGYNNFLHTQRQVPGEAKVTTILFDDKYEVLHNGLDINKIRPITNREYFARGSTALLDAVGKTINNVGARFSNTDENDRPEKVIVVITTDGMENASREFTYERISQMITHQQEKYNWEFLFLGANIDAAKEAASLGIRDGRSSNYEASAGGTAALFNVLSNSIASYRFAGKIEKDWQKDIDKTSKKT